MNETVRVRLSGGRDYPIFIGSGILSEAGTIFEGFARSERAVVITQPAIAEGWGNPLLESLERAGFEPVPMLTFAEGERHKTLRTMARLYEKLYNLPVAVDRKTLIIALGGGIVGDVVGFVAATYLRGLDYVQIPTTLLAMVDSSVGGKTGVDFRQGKNLIGAFHQPRAVLIETETLKTLPAREVRAGMAEVVKYGVIRDPEFLRTCTESAGAIHRGESDMIASIVARCCMIKAAIVAEDEREESGTRAILNFGHTIGHALESATDYKRFKHGEAVAIGMVSAACIGEEVGVTPAEVRASIVEAVDAQGLPTALPVDVLDDDILPLLARDKKAERGRARFVLARALGDVTLMDGIDEKVIRAGLEKQRRLVNTKSIDAVITQRSGVV